MRSKFGLLAAALGLAVVQAAAAADMPLKAATAAIPFNWTGLYVGATAGYVFGSSQHCDPPGSRFCTNSFAVDGFIGGGTLGYNWQWSNWVAGLETDFSGASARGSTTSLRGSFSCGTAVLICRTQLDWFGTVRGRLGAAYDRFLPYVTGGFAYGRLYADLGVPATSNSDTRGGWTMGGGIEYALAPQHWSAKLEYLYVHLGNLFYDTARLCGNLTCTAVHNDFNIVRLGVNYRF